MKNFHRRDDANPLAFYKLMQMTATLHLYPHKETL